MSWTDERIELLKKLWAEGLSASQVSSRLPGTTRSAVIGKVHRLGLGGRAKTTRHQAQQRKKKKPAPPASNLPGRAAQPRMSPSAAALAALGDAEPLPVDMGEELVIPMHLRKSIATLDDGDCRWPIGDPQHEDFHFCGRSKLDGIPYCEFHARRAFQPPRVATGVNLARRAFPVVAGHVEGQETEPAAGGASRRETEDA